MQRHHTGSGRRRVIPDDWSAHHRPLLTGTRDATVTLRRPGGTPGDFDDETGTRPVTPHEPYFTGPARLQLPSSDEQTRLAGEQEVTTIAYAVMLDHAVAGVELGDLCTVTAMGNNGDTWLVGREMSVESIEGGSLHWERRLLCRDNLETPQT